MKSPSFVNVAWLTGHGNGARGRGAGEGAIDGAPQSKRGGASRESGEPTRAVARRGSAGVGARGEGRGRITWV